jgi:hypothetical protein
MKKIKLILLLFFMTGMVDKSFASPISTDRLIYNGKTYKLYAKPLTKYMRDQPFMDEIFDKELTCQGWGCEYIAQWEIIEDQVFLTGIFCCDGQDYSETILSKLFGEKYFEGKVEIKWLTANIISPQGKLLYYIHDPFSNLHETDLEFQFEKGKLIGTKIYDNSKSKQPTYSFNNNELYEFIYSNINWKKVPELDNKKIIVDIRFSANEDGIIDSVKILKGGKKLFNREAIRVIKSIPEWEVYYKHGKHYRREKWIRIVFTDEKRKRYGKNQQKL